MRTILLVVEINNLWKGCHSEFGSKPRLSFSAIIQKAKPNKRDIVVPYALVAKDKGHDYKRTKNSLIEHGYNVCVVNDECIPAAFEALVQGAQGHYTDICFATYNERVIGALNTASKLELRTTLISYGKLLSKELANAADDIRLFTRKDML